MTALATTADLGEKLSPAERAKYRREVFEMKRLKAGIDDHMDAAGNLWVELNQKLADFHAQKLYREYYRNCEDFASAELDLRPAEYYRRLKTAGVVRELLAPDGEGNPPAVALPSSPSALRPMIGLPGETAREVYAEALDSNGGEPPTQTQVKAAVDKVAPRAAKAERPKAGGVEAAVARGIVPAGVVVETTQAEPAHDEDSPIGESDPGSPLSDEDWLETLPARKGLADHVRARFDVWAVCYRNCEKARDMFARATKPFVNVATRAAHGTGPWGVRRASFLRISDPSHWQACGDCGGKAMLELVGECPSCKGQGYHL